MRMGTRPSSTTFTPKTLSGIRRQSKLPAIELPAVTAPQSTGLNATTELLVMSSASHRSTLVITWVNAACGLSTVTLSMRLSVSGERVCKKAIFKSALSSFPTRIGKGSSVHDASANAPAPAADESKFSHQVSLHIVRSPVAGGHGGGAGGDGSSVAGGLGGLGGNSQLPYLTCVTPRVSLAELRDHRRRASSF